MTSSSAEAAGMAAAARDRLRLDEGRVRGMAEGLRKVATLPDPVGEITEGGSAPTGCGSPACGYRWA